MLHYGTWLICDTENFKPMMPIMMREIKKTSTQVMVLLKKAISATLMNTRVAAVQMAYAVAVESSLMAREKKYTLHTPNRI